MEAPYHDHTGPRDHTATQRLAALHTLPGRQQQLSQAAGSDDVQVLALSSGHAFRFVWPAVPYA